MTWQSSEILTGVPAGVLVASGAAAGATAKLCDIPTSACIVEEEDEGSLANLNLDHLVHSVRRDVVCGATTRSDEVTHASGSLLSVA